MATVTPADLIVCYGATTVGTLRADTERRFCFRYQPDWLSRRDTFPISISLPLRSEEFVGGPAHTFFANLLPEGGVRQAVTRRLGISESNDLELLRAIGGECAGALSILPAENAPQEPASEYELFAAKRIQSLITGDTVPLLVGGPTTRLSLAGAQDKVPVAVFDEQLYLPLAGSPSSHILKLPNPRYPNLPVNEAFVLGLAAAAGLRCVCAELVTTTKPASLLVERYDRIRASREITRLHQEDICQALGIGPFQKYEKEGGPTLVQVIEVIRDHVSKPLRDVTRVLEWQIFNVVVGNADGHGKNLSLLYAEDGATLAPFYDLVSTREYAGLDRNLAMSVGGRFNADEITRGQWEALAEGIGMSRQGLARIVEELLDRVSSALKTWRSTFRSQHGNVAVLQTLPRRIGRQSQRISRQLR
jgi:serine/threonine-protein kinase HipA